jgi:hypothetical protein
VKTSCCEPSVSEDLRSRTESALDLGGFLEEMRMTLTDGARQQCQQLKGQTSGVEEQEERSGGDRDQLCFRIKYC